MGHDQRLFTLTTIVSIDPLFEFRSTQQAVGFRDGSLPMDPLWFNGVEPRTFAGSRADDDAHAVGAPFDLLMVLTRPVAHGLAAVPGGVVPDQQQRGEALRRQLGRAPG